MDMPTLEEYQKAVQIVKDHKICEGCKHLFHAKDIHETLYWGTRKFWCRPCYDKVKDDD